MSPLEQTGFEPPVPLAKARVIFGEEKGPEVISVVSKDVVFFPGGPVVRIPFALPASQQPIEAANELTAYPVSEFTRLFSRSRNDAWIPVQSSSRTSDTEQIP